VSVLEAVLSVTLSFSWVRRECATVGWLFDVGRAVTDITSAPALSGWRFITAVGGRSASPVAARGPLRSAFHRAGEIDPTMLERERIIEIVVAVAAVFLMLGAMVAIGASYGAENSTLSPEGGQMLVGVIIGFVLLMTAIGVGLAYVLNQSDDLESDADAKNAV
jgi:hypothetical protein